MRALLVNDASLAGHHGSALVTDQIKLLSARHGLEVVAGWDWNSVLNACGGDAKPFDLVIVNGEGSIHHNAKGARRIAALAATLAARDVPAFLVNATVEACDVDILRGLGAFRFCTVRDTASQRTLAAAGVHAGVVADLTLSASLAGAQQAEDGPLLLTDSSDELKSARLMELGRRWAGVEMMTLRCPPPWPVRGSPVRKYAFEVKRFVAKAAAPGPWTLRYGGALRTRDDLIAKMSRSRGVVAARYHAVCLAILLRLPFVAVEGNTGKAGSLLRDMGLDHRLRALDTLCHRDTPPIVPPFAAWELAAIDAFLERNRRNAEDLFARIAGDARAVRHPLAESRPLAA